MRMAERSSHERRFMRLPSGGCSPKEERRGKRGKMRHAALAALERQNHNPTPAFLQRRESGTARLCLRKSVDIFA